MTGHGAADVPGDNCGGGILRHKTDKGKQLCLPGCPLAAVMIDGKPRGAAVCLHHKDGHRVPVTVRGAALRGPDGKIAGSVEVSPRGVNPYAGLHPEPQGRHDGLCDGSGPGPLRWIPWETASS
jgi:hypothetical protein